MHPSEDGPFVQQVTGLDALPPGYWLHFQATNSMGVPFNPKELGIRWRVTNTDEAAFRANCLRGKFYKSEKNNTRWEQLAYRGVHLVRGVCHSKARQPPRWAKSRVSCGYPIGSVGRTLFSENQLCQARCNATALASVALNCGRHIAIFDKVRFLPLRTVTR